MLPGALLNRRMAPLLVAGASLVALSVAGIALGEPDWITPLLAIAIVVIAMMLGVWGGFFAALVASASFFIGAVVYDGYDPADLANHRHLLFYSLGILVGFFAHGALGDYHLGRALARCRLRRAIRNGEVVLHYQPVAEAATERVVGLEALVRWEHPTRGMLMPGTFIPAAEDDPATILQLTTHTLRLAIAECSGWQDQGYDVGVSVNLSTETIGNAELGEEITRLLAAAGLPPRKLTLEVTESAAIDDPNNVARTLATMRSADTVAIAIDDFGTGYSSLARLEQLPLDTLKIDQLFLRPSPGGPRRRILGSIIGLAHGLGLKACAEGVEDRATWEALVALGCDTVQGYALGYPMPPDQVGPWLEHGCANAPLGMTGKPAPALITG